MKESHERNEGNGVVLTNDQWKQLNEKCILTDIVTHSSYPMFKNITSQDVFPNACYVHDKQHEDGCTYTDFQDFLQRLTEKQCEITVVNPDFTGYRHCDNITLPYAKQLQDALHKSDQHEEYHLEGSTKTKSREECRKNLITNIDQLVQIECN